MSVEMKNESDAIQLKIQQRQTANLEILKILDIVVNRFPDLRFTQILTILNLDKDLFYEESVDTLEHIKKQLEGKLSLWGLPIKWGCLDLTANEGNKNMQRLYGKTYKSIKWQEQCFFRHHKLQSSCVRRGVVINPIIQ